MRVTYRFRNMESSQGVKNFAEEKLSKLQKYLQTPADALEAEVSASLERHLHRADVIFIVEGKRYVAHDESSDLYNSISVAVERIHRQIRDTKELETARKRHSESL